MDRISELSDDLLLKILCYARAEDVVTTSLLSKRWTSLWKHVPKLEYVDINTNITLRFVDNFLQLHKAPVLQTLHLILDISVPQVDSHKWVSVAISRGVRDLKFVQFGQSLAISRGVRDLKTPRSLYKCQSLVKLHLQRVKIADIPLDINFPSLKKLTLKYVNFSSDEVFSIMLSSCPVLEELFMCRSWNGVKKFTIAVPWLQRLVILEYSGGDDAGFVINAPSLKSLIIFERVSQICSLVKMPKLVKAEIDLDTSDSKKLLRCVTSAKHLSLCLKPQMMKDYNPPGDFNQLVSLELCTNCTLFWLNHILRHAPNLRTLRFGQKYCYNSSDIQIKWEQPSVVPECLISSLETVEWIRYRETEAEKEVATYLLANASYLKKMIFKSTAFSNLDLKNRVLMEFESKPRSFSKCLISLIT